MTTSLPLCDDNPVRLGGRHTIARRRRTERATCTTKNAAAPDLCGQSHATGTPTSLSEEPWEDAVDAVNCMVQQAALLFARDGVMQVVHHEGVVPCAPADKPPGAGVLKGCCNHTTCLPKPRNDITSSYMVEGLSRMCGERTSRAYRTRVQVEALQYLVPGEILPAVCPLPVLCMAWISLW